MNYLIKFICIIPILYNLNGKIFVLAHHRSYSHIIIIETTSFVIFVALDLCCFRLDLVGWHNGYLQTNLDKTALPATALFYHSRNNLPNWILFLQLLLFFWCQQFHFNMFLWNHLRQSPTVFGEKFEVHDAASSSPGQFLP